MFIFALLFRNKWVAAAAASLLWAIVQATGSSMPLVTLPLWLFVFGILFLLLFRYGLLACVACAFVGETIMSLPMTLDTDAWYFGASAMAMVALFALSLYSYRTAISAR